MDNDGVPVLSHISSLMMEMDRRYQERFEAQTKALDAAFLAQQAAVQAALSAQERAVGTAMTASEKAVTKAEVAAEKRFDNVNEFRQSLNDIVSTQMPRAEAEQRLRAMTDKLETIQTYYETARTEIVRSFTQRFDELRADVYKNREAITEMKSHSNGMSDGWKVLVGVVGLAATALTIVVVLIAVL